MEYILAVSYILDLVIGDPEGWPHPVRAIGRLIGVLDKKMLARRGGVNDERIKGAILFAVVVGATVLSSVFFIKFSKILSPAIGTLAAVYIGYSSISVKDLWVKTKTVKSYLDSGNIELARKALSMIVGRDTANLDEKEIERAAVETIAESTNDGIIAPIFYFIIAGPAAAIAYKAVNTLDSMVGHKDERYVNFGIFSAIADDIANFIPARITGFLIALASFITGKGFRQSFIIMKRDGGKHASPNSGLPEAAMAGALGLRLGGGAYYDGEFIARPYIGEDAREVCSGDITDAMLISFIASLLIVSSGVFILWLV